MSYEYGTGVEKDEEEAVKYYKMAADQGHADAQINLGETLIRVQRWYVAYQTWIYLHFNIRHLLGLCYENGSGVVKDKVEAVKYFMMAADQGHANAQYNLGETWIRV